MIQLSVILLSDLHSNIFGEKTIPLAAAHRTLTLAFYVFELHDGENGKYWNENQKNDSGGNPTKLFLNKTDIFAFLLLSLAVL